MTSPQTIADVLGRVAEDVVSAPSVSDLNEIMIAARIPVGEFVRTHLSKPVPLGELPYDLEVMQSASRLLTHDPRVPAAGASKGGRRVVVSDLESAKRLMLELIADLLFRLPDRDKTDLWQVAHARIEWWKLVHSEKFVRGAKLVNTCLDRWVHENYITLAEIPPLFNQLCTPLQSLLNPFKLAWPTHLEARITQQALTDLYQEGVHALAVRGIVSPWSRDSGSILTEFVDPSSSTKLASAMSTLAFVLTRHPFSALPVAMFKGVPFTVTACQ